MITLLVRNGWMAAVLGLALAAPMYVQAQGGYTALDRAQMPAYCKYTPGERQRVNEPGSHDPVQIRKWETLLHPAFYGLHHYCWGMMSSNKALVARTRQERVYEHDRAIKEFDYVIRYAPRDFVLMPEILTKKGENLLRLGYLGVGSTSYIAGGIKELQLAIEIKPDYWPPYAALSDHFKKTGELAKAREWLEKALAITPNVKSLTTRLAELDRTKGTKPKAAPEVAQQQGRKPAPGPDPTEAVAGKPTPAPIQETAEPQSPSGG
jgi:tetratricopeptide (TPR) repeat protein